MALIVPKIYNVTVAAIYASAKAQANGSRNQAYTQAIASAFGTAPTVEIQVGGVVKYAAPLAGPLVGNSQGLTLPAFGTPTVNMATNLSMAALALAGTEALVVVNGTPVAGPPTSVPRMTMPVTSDATTDRMRISPPLDGTGVLRHAVGTLSPPDGLDVVEPSGVLTLAETDLAYNSAALRPNEYLIANLNGATGGWRGGCDMAYGSIWSDVAAPKTWNWPQAKPGAITDGGTWYRYLHLWALMCSAQGVSVTGAVDVKDWECQILYKDATSWVRVLGKNSGISYNAVYTISGSDLFESTIPMTWRAGLDGGLSLDLQPGKAPHFIPDIPLSLIPRVEDIEGVFVAALIRRDPRSPAGFSGGMHVGCDPKPNGVAGHPTKDMIHSDGSPANYYINSCISRTTLARTDWTRVVASSVQRPSEFSPRMFAKTRFYTPRPLR
jgi:hypothetical protein